MPLLVDGHNLIGHIPSISLADADDEAQLVMLLRSYATRKRGRQVVVVFDGGIYGHPHRLDGYGIACHFAKSPQDADAQLIRRLRSINRPGDWTLVTSDQQVAEVARGCRVRVIDSHTFAAHIAASPKPAHTPEKQERHLSETEIAEWLHLFGEPADAPPPSTQPDQRKPPPLPPPKKRRHR